MMEQLKSNLYRGSPNIKKDGVSHEYTDEEKLEVAKCAIDPVYFSKTYLKTIDLDKGHVPLKLYDYQEKMFNQFNENRFNIILAARQSGKCARGDSKIKVRNKRTGRIEETTMSEFHEARSSSHAVPA